MCVGLQAIWRRARAAFLKYARERSDELEELYEEQRKGAVAAVEAGIVVTVDCGVSVPLKFQGDLAHYSVVSGVHLTGLSRRGNL